MAEPTFTKVSYVNRTRTLKDGTKKAYRSKCTYQVKDPDRYKNTGATKLSSEQKQEMWELYLGGTQVKELCEKYDLTYLTASRYLDGKKLELLETIKKSKQVNNV